MKNKLLLLLLISSLYLTVSSYGQSEVLVNMAPVDGIDITSGNLLAFQVQSNMKRSTVALFHGTIVFRNAPMRISYEFSYTLQPGLNTIPAGMVHPRFTYSSNSLKELFELYGKLPQGIYEYCVTVTPDYQQAEMGHVEFSECVYHKSEDIFLINLIDPENDAKIYEYNPMLSWTVNYPFAAQLTYRLRVAEIKNGQNTVAAITRNNPVFDEKRVPQTSMMYPVYAKPLVKNQPYAWTVDAYYKDLLLGGAEPWKFTIIEDSLLVGIPVNQSYYEFAATNREGTLYAVDTMKLKYRSFGNTDTLMFELADEDGKKVKYKDGKYGLQPGLNYIDLPFETNSALKHLKKYTITITNSAGTQYQVPFTYIRSLYLNNKK